MKFKYFMFFCIAFCFFVSPKFVDAIVTCPTPDEYGTRDSAVPDTYKSSVDGWVSSQISQFKNLYIVDTNAKTIKVMIVPFITAWRYSGGSWQQEKYYNYTTGTYSSYQFVPGQQWDYLSQSSIPASVLQLLSGKTQVKYTAKYMTTSDIKTYVDKFSVSSAQAQVLYNYSVQSLQVTASLIKPDSSGFVTIGTASSSSKLNLNINTKLLSTYFSNPTKNPRLVATAMGMNVKVDFQASNCNSKVRGLTYFFPVEYTIYYQDACELDQADSTSDSKFSDYWTSNGARKSSKRAYIPTDKMMNCVCTTNAKGTFIYNDFHNKYYSASGGNLEDGVYVKSSNLTVYCKTPRTYCTLDNYKAGKLTSDQLKDCCEATPAIAGFDNTICNTTFDLWCENDTHATDKLTEKTALTYKSYKNEISDSNTACSVSCTETANMVFANNPYVVAGQGFDYYFKVNTSRTCDATYKYKPADWINQYDSYVKDRVAKYSTYKAAKAVYDAYAARCKTTRQVCNSNSCCTGRRAYTSNGVYHASTCKSNSCCTKTTWCDDPNIKKSSYNSTLSGYKTTMDNAYNAYSAALTKEQNFLNDKESCNNWQNAYDIKGDFTLEVEENGTNSYTMDEVKTTTTNNRIVASTPTTLSRLNCGLTATSCSTRTSTLLYSTWSKLTAYTYTYRYPEETYINKLTGEITTTPPDDYYYGGFKYYTSLGTLTGDYDLRVTMNNSGFGAYGQWTLKDSQVPCQYHLENNLSPSDDDDNYPDYGGLGLEFRVVALEDLFPAKHGTIGDNWKSETALVNSIESKGNTVYSGTPIYTITLTPAMMKTIRTYNDKNDNDYADWENFNFDDTSGTSDYLQSLIKKGVVTTN